MFKYNDKFYTANIIDRDTGRVVGSVTVNALKGECPIVVHTYLIEKLKKQSKKNLAVADFRRIE